MERIKSMEQIKRAIAGARSRGVRIGDRVREWSPRRRLVVLVLVPVLLCCCGGVVTVPVVWFIRATVKASAGQPSPDAAAEVYLGTLSSGDDFGLLPVLAESTEPALLAQWHAYRADMTRTDSPPAKLSHTFGPITRTDKRHALVVVHVRPVWFATNGSATYINGTEHDWQITTMEDNGWQVTGVTPYQWCGGYVRTDACR